MIAELQCVVLDCPDPLRLAEFYEDLLGGTVNRPDPRWALDEAWSTLHTPSGLVLAFQRVPTTEYRPPQWPDPAHPSSSTWTSASPTWTERGNRSWLWARLRSTSPTGGAGTSTPIRQDIPSAWSVTSVAEESYS